MFSNLFAICLFVMVCMVKEGLAFCKPFDKASGLAEMCGYSATVNFTHQTHYDKAIKSANYISTRLSSCSDYAKIIACSINIPRCEANIEGPYLPCKRVCYEFNRQCGDQILKYGMEWIIGMCSLLPENDNPNTKLGYRGRCFEPPNFKTNLTKSIPVKCNKLIVPVCQNLGYTQTVLSEEKQKAWSSWVNNQLKAAKSENPACELSTKKFFCNENFLPCINNKVGFYCRPKCERFFQMNCTSLYKASDYIKCMEYPKGTADNDICEYTDWPKALNWPQVRDQQQAVLSSTTSRPVSIDITYGVKTSPVVNRSKPTSTEIKDQKTDSNPNVEGVTKPKLATVVGVTFAVLFVVIIALVIVIFIWKRRRRSSIRSPRPDIERRDKTTKKLLT